MVIDRKTLGAFAVMAGAVVLLVGLLATPALGQNAGGDQYDNDEAICQAVINTILNDVQNDQSDQYVDDVSQELDISPSIVQECLEDRFGDDEPGGGEITNIINIPDKDLPKTGGLSPLVIALSVIAGAGLLVSILRRRS